jgi:hypothetical protein
MWVLLAGCYDLESEIVERRQWEMQDHEADFFTALDALRAGDLATAQRAGEGLGLRDPLPGVPAATAPFLEAVRATGQRLHAAPDLAVASRELGVMVGHCAGCHTAVGVAAPAPVDTTHPQNAAWMAVLFRDEAMWSRAAPSSAAAAWDARLAELLGALPRG